MILLSHETKINKTDTDGVLRAYGESRFWLPGYTEISKRLRSFLFQICTNDTTMITKIPQRIGEVSTFVSKGQSKRSWRGGIQ